MVGNWAFEKLGYADVANKEKQIDLLGLAWEGLLWMRKKALLTAGWLWELTGFSGVEAQKVTVKATSEMAQTGAQLVGDVVRTESTLAAEATKKTATKSSALSAIYSKAASAAAGAYDAIVGIPYVGPFLAPIAAAVAFVSVGAFTAMVGSAKGGEWEVGKDGSPYVLHEKESVLPAGVAENWRRVVGFAGQMVDPKQLVSGAMQSAGALTRPLIPPESASQIPQRRSTGSVTIVERCTTPPA